MGKRSPMTVGKREREQAQREKRERKQAKKQAAAEQRNAPATDVPDESAEPADAPAARPVTQAEPPRQTKEPSPDWARSKGWDVLVHRRRRVEVGRRHCEKVMSVSSWKRLRRRRLRTFLWGPLFAALLLAASLPVLA